MKRAEYRTIKRNLKAAIKAISAYPVDDINLVSFRQQSDCGTLYCGAGILTNVPHFQNQGLYMYTKPNSYGACHPAIHGEPEDYRMPGWNWSNKLFGEGSMSVLFAARHQGVLDSALLSGRIEVPYIDCPVTSDKWLALARLNVALHNLVPVK